MRGHFLGAQGQEVGMCVAAFSSVPKIAPFHDHQHSSTGHVCTMWYAQTWTLSNFDGFRLCMLAVRN